MKARRGFAPVLELLGAILIAALILTAAVWYVHTRGYTLYFGDAAAHLNIARRIIDSKTPGYEQIGTVWLPLPHVLMIPFVRVDEWWRSGLAGAIPAAIASVIAAVFLFLSVRRLLSPAAGFLSLLVFLLNPNVLYLGSTPMTEPFFFASLFSTLYFCTLARDLGCVWAAALAGLTATAGTLVRYDGWFLLPFFALYLFIASPRRCWRATLVFCLCASIGPLYWLGHNWILYTNPLEFYNGPYSAKAIYQRALANHTGRYPGDHEWKQAFDYVWAACSLVSGQPLLWLSATGALVAIIRRAGAAVILLTLLPLFYVLSLYSSGTPIYVPHLWPNTHYNTRYGLAIMPLLALSVGALATIVPTRFRPAIVILAALAAASPWIAKPGPESSICFNESRINSEARRKWTRIAGDYLKQNYKFGDILAPFGDLTGIFQHAGIPLYRTIHEGNSVYWLASAYRPELFLRSEWVIALAGDPAARAVLRSQAKGHSYRQIAVITISGERAVEIYRRGSEVKLPQEEHPPIKERTSFNDQ